MSLPRSQLDAGAVPGLEGDAARRGFRIAPIQLMLLGAMAAWGFNVPVVKALTGYFDPMLTATLRMCVACAVLSLLFAWRTPRVPLPTLRQWGAVLVIACLMVYANQVLFAYGMQLTSGTNAAVIIAINPIASMLFAALFFRERLTAMRIAGVLLGLAGVALVIVTRPGAVFSSAGLGDLLVLLSVFSFVCGGGLVQRLARGLDVLTIAWAMHAAGTAMLLLHAAVQPKSYTMAELSPGAYPWALVLFSGGVATAFGSWAWNRGIATIGMARTAVWIYWMPFFGVGFSVLWLGEPFSLWHLAGLVTVIAGTLLGARRTVAA